MSMRLGACALGVGLAALATASPRPTDACINGYERRVDPRVHHLVLAEKHAEDGRHVDALVQLGLAFPALPSADAPLEHRARVVFARSVARSRGLLHYGGKPREGDAARAEVLEIARSVAEARVARSPSDTAARTDLAEILALLPDRRSDARRMLEELEQKQLVASAHGYAALAHLRDDAGAGAPAWVRPALVAMTRGPRAIAIARCRAMTTDESVCDGPSARVAAERSPPRDVRAEAEPKRL